MDDKTDPSSIERDPETEDAVLSGRIGPSVSDAGQGADPAAEELKESAVVPVGVAAVDVVATAPQAGAEQAVPARWALSDSEIRSIILGVCLAMFVSALNQTIIATALPTIGREFHDLENLSWLITAYLLSSTIAAPLCGKLSDIYGRRLVMMSALGVFVVGSIACALAPNMLTLILMRGLQGIGGGGIVPMVQATVADAVAPRERGRYQAYIGSVWVAAGIAGPVAGGYFADHLHWSVVFWVNVPLGLAAAYMINRQLKRLPVNYRKHKLDLFGATLMISSAILLLLALTWGGVRYPWLSSTILLLVACALALGLAFAYRVAHEPEPFLPLAVLANPVVRTGTFAVSCAIGVSIGLTVFMPLYYENVYHLSAADSGLALIPIAVMTTPGSVASGRVMMYFDRYKWFPLIGLSCATVAMVVMAVWPRLPLWAVIVALSVFGAGAGTVFSCTTVCIQNAVSRYHVGTATGVMNFFRALASALVVAIIGAIILAGVGAGPGGAGRAVDVLAQAGGAAVDLSGVFRWVFAASALFLLMSIGAFSLMEERPLRGRSEGPR
ncbi:MAG TPA: MDR family MFS transporter [Xanthobacteraceae bacterium]|nr:MDR family MFS transporter [Xanthobacteraceae bacterium]